MIFKRKLTAFTSLTQIKIQGCNRNEELVSRILRDVDSVRDAFGQKPVVGIERDGNNLCIILPYALSTEVDAEFSVTVAVVQTVQHYIDCQE